MISANTHMDISMNYSEEDMLHRVMDPTISTKLSYQRKTVKDVYFMESSVLKQEPYKVVSVRKNIADFKIIEQSHLFSEIEDISMGDDG